MNRSQLLCGFILLSFSSPALAYIGPGMGGGVLAAAIGIVGSLLLALFGVVYYPIKRMRRKRKEMLALRNSDEEKAVEEDREEPGPASN